MPERAWLRRCLTIPAVGLALALVLASLPALALAALVTDLVVRRRWNTLRVLAFVVFFLAHEVWCLLRLAVVGLRTVGDGERRRALTFAQQDRYARAHLGAARRLFSLRFEVQGLDAAASGPFLLLVRHTSLIDTVLPGVFVAAHHRLHLRYVLKKELLAGPCLDIAGHWLPNHFVDRSGARSEQEALAVGALGRDLGPEDGVCLFPEGTRFTPRARERLLARLPPGPERARAERLRHVLPVRPGGLLALLEAASGADVVFLAHHGMEGLARLTDIWAGRLLGTTVHLKLWRVAARDIPREAAERLAWADAQWASLDAWLEAQDAPRA